MSLSRRQRVEEGHRRAAEVSAAASACAQNFVEFCAERRACLELVKQHGLSRGVVEYEQALLRLEQQSSKVRAVFKLGKLLTTLWGHGFAAGVYLCPYSLCL
jgi:hypothetical protein